MDTIWYYYIVLVGLLTGIIIHGVILYASSTAPIREHYIGVNLTKHDGNCIVTWLGGWDFDSFYTNVTVNGENKGHPSPMTEIYNDTCKDIVVTMHDKAVRTDVELYRYNSSGV